MTPRRPVVLLLLLLASLNLPSHSQSLQPDAVSLLSFKSKADLDNSLLYAIHEPYDYCQWKGTKCGDGGRVVRLSLPSSRLRGTFPDNTLSGLRLLRVLNLRNNSLSGPIPDLSPLLFLKYLSLSHNSFSSSIPPSVASLRNLAFLDLSCNRLNGTVPPLNLIFLSFFNVSENELSGVVPSTSTLSIFGAASFVGNPGLCGEIVNKACKSGSPFFGSNSSSPLGQSAQAEGGGNVVVVVSPPTGCDRRNKRKLNAALLAVAVAVSLLAVALLVTFFAIMMKRPKCPPREDDETGEETAKPKQDDLADERQVVPVTTTTTKASKPGDRKINRLVFCGGSGEGAAFGMEELMRASAELLGRGTMGTTYKAVMEGGRVVITVKRLDAGKTSCTSAEAFERHMEAVGGAHPHPNLVSLLAYFQANGERLLVYRYHPNGSLFNLLHGSRSARAKPLHWTSCLKIAEDVAQGLSHIHQVCKLVHGNLKSSNVLLGADFEACITDCSLAVLADKSCAEDPDSAACRAPESRNTSRRATVKSDVYAFGVLVVELLTGKFPSQHPYLAPSDMLDWVRAMRDDDTADYDQLGKLTEVASICTLTSPEQRPAMWQVLKMIQEIKESVLAQDNAVPPHS